jgi:P pilus assembly chaperone PapD
MRFLGKKGQSALEYLMTYGWALVVIVIAVAALVVLINPQTIQGNQCDTKFGQFTVTQSDVQTGQTQLVMVNQTGQTVNFSSVNVAGTSSGTSAYDQNISDTTQFDPNETQTVTLTHPVDIGSGSYNLAYTITYSAGQLSGLTATGSCRGTI